VAAVFERPSSGMARNIEIKARIPSVAALLPRVAGLATEGPARILQNDTFFVCPHGRLKLRIFELDRGTDPVHGELIFYRRADAAGPKESSYLRTAISDPRALRETLSLAYGELGRVAKRRTLFLIGRTRVHLDEVDELGDFLELEVVLQPHESSDAGVREARSIMTSLGIEPAQLIERAYLDLLRARRGPG
jgi:predicted adenylyl cyclase CyaB